jgi:hypothetical protein
VAKSNASEDKVTQKTRQDTVCSENNERRWQVPSQETAEDQTQGEASVRDKKTM